MRTLAIFCILSLAACATPEQRADETAAFIAESYGPTCVKLGYATESEGHRNCMLQMFNTDQLRLTIPWGRYRR